MISYLSGKKTYILGALALATIGAFSFGWIDADAANTLLAVLGFGSVITLRAAISKQ